MIVTAKRLAKAGPRRPRQADLKRAISTAYYALFHAIAGDAADLLVGRSSEHRSDEAWRQTYRALQHGFAKNACERVRTMDFPPEIRGCADAFVTLQEARHLADYDPVHRVARPDALAAISLAERAIAGLKGSAPRDRRAFAVQLLFPKRK